MEERVGVGDSVLLVVHSSVWTAVLVKVVHCRSVLNQSGLVTGQSQFVHLSVGGVTDANRQTGEKQIKVASTARPAIAHKEERIFRCVEAQAYLE